MFVELRQSQYPSLREELIRRHIRIVYWSRRRIKTRLAIRPDEWADVISDGMIGLIQAVDSYAPKEGKSFFAFAKRLIVRRMYDGYRSRRDLTNWMVVSHRRIEAIRTQLSMSGEEPTPAEIAEALGMQEETVRSTLEVVARSLDVKYLADHPAGSPHAYDELLEDPSTSADVLVEELDTRERLQSGLQELSEAERSMIFWRYGEDRTISEIARDEGVSEYQVKTLATKALMELRTRFGCGDNTSLPGKRTCKKRKVKLDEDDVRTILTRFQGGAKLKEVCEEFDISATQASLIRNGKRWRHVYLEFAELAAA